MIKFSGKVEPLDTTSIKVSPQSWEVEKLKNLENNQLYVIEIKKFKSKRSLQQNSLMWELINKINFKLNGFKADKDSEMEIYCQIIQMAQIKRELVATVPEAKDTLEQVFRVVKEVGTITTASGVLKKFLLYKGSSHFNTEEMSRFIDQLLDYAEKVGIDTREYDQ